MKTPIASILLPLLALAAGCHPAAPPASVIRMAPEAETTQLIGEGRLSADPEYMEMTVTVHSECFANPLEASSANDAAAARVLQLLRSAIDSDNPGDGVFTQGGLTQPFSRYVNNRVVCDRSFQKTTTMVIKTSRLDEFPREFARIQKAILGGTLSKPASQAGTRPLTYATIRTPVPRLNYETRERLEKEALAAALASARAKFRETVKDSCGGEHRIVKFLERQPDNGRPIPYQATSGSKDAVIAPEAIWINKTLEVHFEIAANGCRA